MTRLAVVVGLVAIALVVGCTTRSRSTGKVKSIAPTLIATPHDELEAANLPKKNGNIVIVDFSRTGARIVLGSFGGSKDSFSALAYFGKESDIEGCAQTLVTYADREQRVPIIACLDGKVASQLGSEEAQKLLEDCVRRMKAALAQRDVFVVWVRPSRHFVWEGRLVLL